MKYNTWFDISEQILDREIYAVHLPSLYIKDNTRTTKSILTSNHLDIIKKLLKKFTLNNLF